jgi:glycosyltransferase involved in cell wall biosynthesis
MNIVHLTASTFFGGPERQMLGLARHLPLDYRSFFLSFSEGGRCQGFLQAARVQGHQARPLVHDTPHFRAAVREIAGELSRVGADILCCHGYKAGLLGRLAARRADVPVVAVSRGWTAENLKVRLYEWLDRFNLRWMDRVVCVSEGQAARVLRAGVDPGRVAVIHNSIDTDRFARPDRRYGCLLKGYFSRPPRFVVGAAGRLSPEKGFGVLLDAARKIAARDSSIGFIHFGDGPLRDRITRQIERFGLGDRFILAGQRPDLDRFIPFFDLMVLPSYTEGLPNVVLEAFGASIPVVATAVGGTPEVVEHGTSGYLVPPGDVETLAWHIHEALACDERRRGMGRQGKVCVRERFTFAAQARGYEQLFARLLSGGEDTESPEEDLPADPDCFAAATAGEAA